MSGGHKHTIELINYDGAPHENDMGTSAGVLFGLNHSVESSIKLPPSIPPPTDTSGRTTRSFIIRYTGEMREVAPQALEKNREFIPTGVYYSFSINWWNNHDTKSPAVANGEEIANLIQQFPTPIQDHIKVYFEDSVRLPGEIGNNFVSVPGFNAWEYTSPLNNDS